MYRFIHVYIYSTLKLIPHTGFGRETLVSLWLHPSQPNTGTRPEESISGAPSQTPWFLLLHGNAQLLRQCLFKQLSSRELELDGGRGKAVFEKLVVFLLMLVKATGNDLICFVLIDI